MLVPKLFTSIQNYNRPAFLKDLTAGMHVGVVALPLSIAFAAASGVAPNRGLITAVIAGLIVSLLGGSRVQIAGPTGALVVVVYATVHRFGPEGLAMATLMAGVILIALGLSRLGSAIKFIPFPVTAGFTSGIAVLIFSSQVKDLLGLRMGDVPPGFVAQWRGYLHTPSVDVPTALLGACSLLLIVVLTRVSRRIPGFVVALLLGTLAVRLLHLPVQTIGSRFGALHAGFPIPSLRAANLDLMLALVPSAFTIALLCAVSSLLSAVVTDGMTGGRHRSNMELVAQGVANVVSPLFGGMPAAGAIARTATNVKSGARTPVSGIVHALTLLAIMAVFGRWTGHIPLATLAAILVVVAYNMSEWRTLVAELTAPRSDVFVLVVTLLLTVLVDLSVAIEVGLVAASLLFMRRMAEVTNVSAVTGELRDQADRSALDPNAVARRSIPEDVEVFEVNGPFFFGAVEAFKDTLGRIAEPPAVLIIRMRHVPAIDSSGLHALTDVVRRARHDGSIVLLSDVHTQPLLALSRSAALDEIGDENVFGNLDDALTRARDALGLPVVARPACALPTVARETLGTPMRLVPSGPARARGRR